AVLSINGHSAGPPEYIRSKGSFFFVVGVEDRHMALREVGDEETVVVVDRQAVDQPKAGLVLVANQVDIGIFLIEDKDRTSRLIGDIDVTLGIDRNSKRAEKLGGDVLFFLGLRLVTCQAIHPLLLGL